MQQNEFGKPAKCPYCGSSNIETGLGRWECRDCGQEGSYRVADAYVASMRLQMAAEYIRDLELFAAGDVARFSRMVDTRGAGLGSDAQWRAHVATMLTDGKVALFVPGDTWRALAARAVAVGVQL